MPELIAKRKAIPEGEGTLFDNACINACIFSVSELAVGNTHSHANMPFPLAGSAGGYFRTGRYVVFDGASHNDLLVSLLHAYGIDEETFGDPAFCSGGLSGLT